MDDTEREPLPLGERFDRALHFASRHHRQQARKGTHVPYVAHLLQVAGLVLEAGADEDVTIAALLHDAIEDDPAGDADAVRREIREQFGARVLGTVDALTDADTIPKPPWQARKEAYLAQLRLETSPDVLLVSCADKLHNVRSIIDALRMDGPAVWQRFNGGREGTLWYYRDLRVAYHEAGGTPLLAEYSRAVADLERLIRTMPDADGLDAEENEVRLPEWHVVFAADSDAPVVCTLEGEPVATIHSTGQEQFDRALLVARAPSLRDAVQAALTMFEIIAAHDGGPAREAALDIIPALESVLQVT